MSKHDLLSYLRYTKGVLVGTVCLQFHYLWYCR